MLQGTYFAQIYTHIFKHTDMWLILQISVNIIQKYFRFQITSRSWKVCNNNLLSAM